MPDLNSNRAEDTVVLIVEDDQFTQDTIKQIISPEVNTVLVASSASEARQIIGRSPPDLVILDINLPDELGFSLAREIRSQHETAIIVLTARDSDGDRLLGLELGADEYLTKPVNPLELSIRVRNILIRHLQWAKPSDATKSNREKMTFGAWQFTPAQRLLEKRSPTKHQSGQYLTRNEADVLELIARNPDQTFTREDIVTTFSRDDTRNSVRAVDNIIMRLRRKLGETIKTPGHILTVSGHGYRFITSPDGFEINL